MQSNDKHSLLHAFVSLWRCFFIFCAFAIVPWAGWFGSFHPPSSSVVVSVGFVIFVQSYYWFSCFPAVFLSSNWSVNHFGKSAKAMWPRHCVAHSSVSAWVLCSFQRAKSHTGMAQRKRKQCSVIWFHTPTSALFHSAWEKLWGKLPQQHGKLQGIWAGNFLCHLVTQPIQSFLWACAVEGHTPPELSWAGWGSSCSRVSF